MTPQKQTFQRQEGSRNFAGTETSSDLELVVGSDGDVNTTAVEQSEHKPIQLS